MSKEEIRPYELPRQQYALWYEVGARLGTYPQMVVQTALCGQTNVLPKAIIDEYNASVIIKMAQKRGVVLTYH